MMYDGRKFRNWEERECGRGGEMDWTADEGRRFREEMARFGSRIGEGRRIGIGGEFRAGVTMIDFMKRQQDFCVSARVRSAKREREREKKTASKEDGKRGTDGMVVRGVQGWSGLGKGEENAEDGREVRREWNRRSMGRFSATVEGEDLARNGGVGRAGGGRR